MTNLTNDQEWFINNFSRIKTHFMKYTDPQFLQDIVEYDPDARTVTFYTSEKYGNFPIVFDLDRSIFLDPYRINSAGNPTTFIRDEVYHEIDRYELFLARSCRYIFLGKPWYEIEAEGYW